MIIANNEQKNKSFQLAFNLHGAEGGEFLDYKLPYPNAIEHLNGFIRIAWLIDGYTGTKASKEFLNDIIARFLISYATYQPQRIPYKLDTLQNEQIHKLKDFKTLESIKRRSINVSRADNMAHAKDAVFFAIKFYAEALIQERGICQYELLEDFAISNFLDNKDRSTLKAKCRSIYYWYEERDFKLTNYQHRPMKEYLEETKMTRIENCKLQNEKKADKNQRLVVNATTGTMKELYKKKNGKWNISLLAKDLKLNRRTIMKYMG